MMRFFNSFLSKDDRKINFTIERMYTIENDEKKKKKQK